jgi:hypothetical protein
MIFKKTGVGEAAADEGKLPANIRRRAGWEMAEAKRIPGQRKE